MIAAEKQDWIYRIEINPVLFFVQKLSCLSKDGEQCVTKKENDNKVCLPDQRISPEELNRKGRKCYVRSTEL